MAFKRSTIFPNYLYEGQITIPEELNVDISESITSTKDSGITIDMTYGWYTNKQFPLEGVLPKLSGMMAQVFVEHVVKDFNLKIARDIELLNPYLVSVKPSYTYQVNIEPQRWYNGIMFLQTTNKGSHLCLNNFDSKVYASQNTQENNIFIKPKKHKVAFWPSHVPWSLSPNMSMVDSIALIVSFRADAKR
tara:strand:+ start:402 stop:974 length:573 start_codon:yes stop_codon:yes gene_type:complete